jgi:molecular chaperone DnaK (HSP70)
MAVFGVDLGNLNSVVSIARKGGVDVIVNEVSKRDTTSMVSFGDKERFLGEKAVDLQIRNWQNTVGSLKRLLGIKFDSPAAAHEKQFVKNDLRADENGYIEIKVNYKFKERWFKPEQLIGMLFTNLRSHAEREVAFDAKAEPGSIKVVDCVVSCPVYFTSTQRLLLLQALNIAGLSPLSLINETTSAALDWGIFKSSSLPEEEKDSIIIALVDIGHSATTCSIVAFTRSQLKVLGHVYDEFLGVRDLDYQLFLHFSSEVKRKYGVDLQSHKKNTLKFMDSVDKCKKVLSANQVAILNCELGDCDVSIPEITREFIEKLFSPLINKLRQLLQRALQIPGADRISAVEIIGGGSRIPSLKACVAEIFQKPAQTTLNASESIAKGCGIMGAMLSPKFRVREFSVIDASVFAVDIGYNSEKAQNPIKDSHFPAINKKIVVLRTGDACPKTLNLTFDRSEDFELYGFYEENSNLENIGSELLIGRWKVSGIPSLPSQPSVKVKLRINPSMIINVEGAQVVEEWEEEEIVEEPISKPENAKKDPAQDPPAKEPQAQETSQPMQVDNAPPEKTTVKKIIKKKQSKKYDCAVTPCHTFGHNAERLVDLKEQENQMIQSDINVHRTLESKNSLEAFIYDMRSKICNGGIYFEFITPKDRDTFSNALSAAENWLYGDGEDAAKEDYIEKLTELQNTGTPVTKRYNERKTLPAIVLSCQTRTSEFLNQAHNKDGKLAHISAEELQKVVCRCQDFLGWLDSEVAKCNAVPLTQDLPLSCTAIQAKLKDIESFCLPILSKPKPKEEKKKEEPKKNEGKDEPIKASEPKEEKKEMPEVPDPTPDSVKNSKMDLD